MWLCMWLWLWTWVCMWLRLWIRVCMWLNVDLAVHVTIDMALHAAVALDMTAYVAVHVAVTVNRGAVASGQPLELAGGCLEPQLVRCAVTVHVAVHVAVPNVCVQFTSNCFDNAALPSPSPPCRVEGLKRVSLVAVGEKHSLALQRWVRGAPEEGEARAGLLAQEGEEGADDWEDATMLLSTVSSEESARCVFVRVRVYVPLLSPSELRRLPG